MYNLIKLNLQGKSKGLCKVRTVNQILISTFNTSKLSGVHSTTNTTRLNVCTPTITKISDVDQTFTYMRLSFVKIGKAVPLSLVMRRAADDLKSALTLTGGKNNNFTH